MTIREEVAKRRARPPLTGFGIKPYLECIEEMQDNIDQLLELGEAMAEAWMRGGNNEKAVRDWQRIVGTPQDATE